MYVYTNNNPTRQLDESGHSALLIASIAGGAIGGAMSGWYSYCISQMIKNEPIDYKEMIISIAMGTLSGTVGGFIGTNIPEILKFQASLCLGISVGIVTGIHAAKVSKSKKGTSSKQWIVDGITEGLRNTAITTVSTYIGASVGFDEPVNNAWSNIVLNIALGITTSVTAGGTDFLIDGISNRKRKYMRALS